MRLMKSGAFDRRWGGISGENRRYVYRLRAFNTDVAPQWYSPFGNQYVRPDDLQWWRSRLGGDTRWCDNISLSDLQSSRRGNVAAPDRRWPSAVAQIRTPQACTPTLLGGWPQVENRESPQRPQNFDGIVPADSGGVQLKAILYVLLCGAMTASSVAQDKPIKIMLASTSTTPATYLIENLPKDGCSNVSIVTDASQADYTLEAQAGDFEGAKGSQGPHGPQAPRPRAKYTLSKNGAVIFGTTPIKEKSAVKDLCKYLQHPTPKQ